METFEDVEIPTCTLPNGRFFISLQDAVEQPSAAAFVARYPNYWAWDDLLMGWISPATED